MSINKFNIFIDPKGLYEHLTSSFSLDDIVINNTIMYGLSTSNHHTIGIVKRIITGVCFEVENQQTLQLSLLWSDFKVYPPTLKKNIMDFKEIESESILKNSIPSAPKLRRTDSGADYGFHGFPDCDFWILNGIQPIFIATDRDYTTNNYNNIHPEIHKILLDHADIAKEKGGEYYKAWKNQMDHNKIKIEI